MVTTCAEGASAITCLRIITRKKNEYAKGARMNESKFREWFVEQFGQRPDNGGTDSELKSEIWVGKQKAKELAKRLEYDVKMESALYAWNARTK